MKPMEAWSIISANLAHLVRIRRCQGDPKGYVDAETEAEVITFKALQEMQQRMYPTRLEIDELRGMVNEPVWAVAGGFQGWGIVGIDDEGIFVTSRTADGYSINWRIDEWNARAIMCYRYKPTGVDKDA